MSDKISQYKYLVPMILLASLLNGVSTQASFAQKIPYAGERIILSVDGNEHSKNAWGATPLSLALFAAYGLQDQVIVYSFSGHTWGSNKINPSSDAQMRESAFIGAKQFGFKKTKFIEAVNAPNYAIIEIAEQINKSSQKNPLLILAGGSMEIIGTALNEADSTKLTHVRLLSHSSRDGNHAEQPEEWESHKGWTWEKIKESFAGKGLKMEMLLQEEGEEAFMGLKANEAQYAWIKNSSMKDGKPFQKGSWDWLYSRLEVAKEGDEMNPADAGLVLYLLTGKQKISPEDVRAVLENPGKLDYK
jgi:hypothetical protein